MTHVMTCSSLLGRSSSVRVGQVEAGAEELGLSLEKFLDATSFWETYLSQRKFADFCYLYLRVE